VSEIPLWVELFTMSGIVAAVGVWAWTMWRLALREIERPPVHFESGRGRP
jgi:hypothetical protein